MPGRAAGNRQFFLAFFLSRKLAGVRVSMKVICSD